MKNYIFDNESIKQINKLSRIMQPAFIEAIDQQNKFNRIMQPAFIRFIKQQNKLPFLNNRFAWIGAIENFQQVVSNMALTTDMLADKFALDITTEEILPLFKELDEKVVADVVDNKNITFSKQSLATIKKLLIYKATLIYIFGLMSKDYNQYSTEDILGLVLSILLDYFDKKLNSK